MRQRNIITRPSSYYEKMYCTSVGTLEVPINIYRNHSLNSFINVFVLFYCSMRVQFLHFTYFTIVFYEFLPTLVLI